MKKNYKNWIDKNINKDKLINKTILITGGNSGIGFEVAKFCAYLKMNIIIACRNKQRAKNSILEIKKEYTRAKISYLLLDTSKIESVSNFCDEIIKNNIDIDLFYSNAGVFNLPKELTNDGFERVIETNYIGPFLLTHYLLDYFKHLNHPVKLIYTTSVTAKRAKINYDDINSITTTSKYKTYAESKLLNAHLYLYLIKICNGTNLIPLLVHPGITATPIISKAYPKWFARVALSFMKIFFHSSQKAALSTIKLLDSSITSPNFIGPRGIYNISGYPKENKLSHHMKKDFLKSIHITKNLLNID